MLTTSSHRLVGLLSAAAALSLVAGCASRGPNASLDQARASVNQAASQADVVRLAPVELKQAQDAVAQGDRMLAKDGDGADVTHMGYLASRQAEIALATTRARLADERIKTGNDQVTQLRLQARTAEAEQARAVAAQAQASAADARNQAAVAQDQAARATAKLNKLAERLAEIEGQQSERGFIVTLGDILFQVGRSDLLPTAGPRLDKLASVLTQYPDRKVLIEGHTDATGSLELNNRLSLQRAQAIKMALMQRGIAADRIDTRGYGPAFPVADNTSPEGRAQNRRVEVVIANDEGIIRARR